MPYDRESDAFALTSIGTAAHGTVVNNEVSGGSFVTDTTYTIASIGTTDYTSIGASANTVGTVFTATGAGSGTGTVFDGTVTYTPGKNEDDSNYTGPDEFSYLVTDEYGAEATGTVSVTVSVVNRAPVAIADTTTVAEDSSNNRVSVLINDTDPESNTLSLDSVSTASYGTVTVAGTNVLYTPDANFAGSDSFSYWVSDSKGGSTKGEVSITVTPTNDAPTAKDDTLGAVSANKPTTMDLLANDTDPDGDVLTISDVGDATYGKVTISGGGATVRFVATRGSSGNSDSFTYTITDADGETDTATVNFTISANTNPNAINDKYAIEEDASATQFAVLDNDIDMDGDSVSVLSINTAPEHGTAEISNGKIFYVPTSNYNGTDSFTYIVKDGQGGRDEATVAITVTSVNDAPILVNDSITVDAGSSDNVISVLDNDSDVDAGDDISISSVADALHGTVTLTAGVLTYTPGDGYTGADSFTYQVSDGTDESSATVSIIVSAGNTLPTIVDDTPTVIEDSRNQLVDVLANDDDVDGDDLSVVSVTQSENGTVQLTSGSVFYTPDTDFAGTDFFTYTASDGNGGISSARVTMTVTGVEDDPTAVNDILDTVEAGSGQIVIDLISNDFDVDGDDISITAVGAALNGTVLYTAGVIYYKPGSSVGSDVFTYTLADENDNEVTGYASIDVIAANNSPTGAVTITGGTQPYQTLTVSNTMADSDGITGDFTYQWYDNGVAMLGETSTSYTVTLEDVGSAFSVKASYTDNLGHMESKTSDETSVVSMLDQPFYFEASDIDENGMLKLTLKADVEAIYSRSDINSLTAATLNLSIDWTKFDGLGGVGTTKYSTTTVAGDLILLQSSSTGATDTFDTITLASLRLIDPLLTLVDTDEATLNVGTSDSLLEILIKPLDPSEKVSISLSGTIEANQGQVTFSQYDATINNITGVVTNSDPVGAVSFQGTIAVGETLNVSHSISDADGMGVVSYQWLRDGDAINNATNSAYVIVNADINKDLSVKATYTDVGGTVETVTSSSSEVIQSPINKPLMFISDLITASKASIELYGADYSLDPTETILKLTLNGDITRFDESNSSLYTSVTGAEINVSLDWNQFEDIEYNGASMTYQTQTVYTGLLFVGMVTNDDNEFSKIVFSSLNVSSEPVLTLIDSVETIGMGKTDRPPQVDLLTIYLNPIDSIKDVEIVFDGDIFVNQGADTFTQLSHTLEVATKTYDAIISTSATETTITKLDNVSVNLWSGDTDTGTSIAVDDGEISIDNTVSFTAVKLSATDAYDFDIEIGDAIHVLRHIVDLAEITQGSSAFHAADTDNNGNINISDAIDILRHIVDLQAIDTFDLIDSEGNRVTQLDANASGEPPTWTIVANGDVDMSGSFADDYVVTMDIV